MTLDDALEPWGCGSKQTELIERVCEAVAGLDLGAVLTLGPAVDRGNAGSASKRLAPGLRLGWLLSPASLLQDLTLE